MIDAEEYLRRVDLWLRDLPWKVRQQLVAELRGHLSELPAGTDLLEQLGTTKQYAADLRAAAGLERCRGPIAFLRARRPRNVVLTVVVFTVIGLAIGAVAWIDSYQPLAFGNVDFYPSGAVFAPVGDSASVVFRKGRPFKLGITVQNTGAFTVRITGGPVFVTAAGGFPRSPDRLLVLPISARLMMSGPVKIEEGAIPGPFKRFHPFDLKPGWEGALILKGVYACPPHIGNPDGTILEAIPVRFSFLWRSATVGIPLPETLGFFVPKGTTPCRRPNP